MYVAMKKSIKQKPLFEVNIRAASEIHTFLLFFYAATTELFSKSFVVLLL